MLYIFSTWEKDKKHKQTEAEVKIIGKSVFIKLLATLIVRNLSGSMDVRMKSILAFKICKLTSLEYFEFRNRNVLVAVVSA